jgi:flagellar assembly factor FliW
MPQVETQHFGCIDIPEAEVIEFGRGLLGFESLRRFVHIEREEEHPFGWLQSLDDPAIVFVVANPRVFFPTYEVLVDPRELGDVKPGANDRLLVLGICTVPEKTTEITMNLQGPLVINCATRRGKQLVLNRSPYRTQHRLTDVESESAAAPPAAPRMRPPAPARSI